MTSTYPDMAVAVDAALTRTEIAAMAAQVLMAGQQPREWIRQTWQADNILGIRDQWWQRHGGNTATQIAYDYGLPRDAAQQLIFYCIVACSALGTLSVLHAGPVLDLAGRAASWFNGYTAQAQGQS